MLKIDNLKEYEKKSFVYRTKPNTFYCLRDMAIKNKRSINQQIDYLVCRELEKVENKNVFNEELFCTNCDTYLPDGCQGLFKNDNTSCLLNKNSVVKNDK